MPNVPIQWLTGFSSFWIAPIANLLEPLPVYGHNPMFCHINNATFAVRPRVCIGR